MKKIKKLIMAIIVVLFCIGCEEDFNPYGEFKESYIFNCIIRCDTTFQIATIDSNYVVDGYDPYENHNDPSIKGATVRVWANNTLRVFNQTEIARADTSRYKTPYSYYCTDNFQPDPNTILDLEVILSNGKKLTAYCRTPSRVTITMIDSDRNIPPEEADYIKVRWGWEITTQIYVPLLYIVYYQNENGTNVRYEKQVPVSYEKVDDQYIPNYLGTTNNVAITYDMDVIDRAMTEISEGDPGKENYTIYSAIFEVIALDDFLSKYYSSTTVSSNGFSVKVDETDYTNINGGHGIFGSYSKSRYSLKLSHDYIRSFGYVPGLTE